MRRRRRSRRLRDQVLERNREDDDKKFNVTEAMESTDRPSVRSVGRSQGLMQMQLLRREEKRGREILFLLSSISFPLSLFFLASLLFIVWVTHHCKKTRFWCPKERLRVLCYAFLWLAACMCTRGPIGLSPERQVRFLFFLLSFLLALPPPVLARKKETETATKPHYLSRVEKKRGDEGRWGGNNVAKHSRWVIVLDWILLLLVSLSARLFSFPFLFSFCSPLKEEEEQKRW